MVTKRPEFIRKNTNLKLEGDMYIKTETLDKYVAHEYQERPALIKKTTNLHMEGEMETKTEKNEQFVPFKLEKRPPLTKRDTNLHMEGTLSLVPEYKERFVEYNRADRPSAILPIHNLKPGGEFEMETESKSRFQNIQRSESVVTVGDKTELAAGKPSNAQPPMARLKPRIPEKEQRRERRIDNNPEYAHPFEMTGIPGLMREYIHEQ